MNAETLAMILEAYRRKLASGRRGRSGMTLFELVAMVTIIGIFAATAASRFGRVLFAEFGSQGETRELSLALLNAQRAAINSGDDHYVEFLSSGGRITRYQIVRDTGTTTSVVVGPVTLSTDVTVTTSHAIMRYNFEGSSAWSYWIQVAGQARVWRIDVTAINGSIRVRQTS